jgi:peptidoglycan/LPS O-acetylase OafA/YrhL
MLVIDTAKEFEKDRKNNFSLLRLFFATLVIISHSPEFLDGNRSREILTRLFGTMSFGEVGVHGFFIISGYLITKSFVEGRSTTSYLMRRMLRIIPGYLVSFLVCVLLIGPFVGGGQSLRSPSMIWDLFYRIVTLRPPNVPGVFPGLPYQSLNGPMWTIAYEFRCYLATAFIGLLGLYHPRYRTFLLAVLIALLVLNATDILRGVHTILDDLSGFPRDTVDFAAVFGVGALYYLFRDKLPLTSKGAVAAGIVLIALLFDRALAATAFTIFGGYLILWFALKAPVLSVSRLANKVDISYGLYLYACPIQQIIAWNDRTINPWLLCCISTLGAGLLGYASWKLVEKPMLGFVQRRPPAYNATGQGRPALHAVPPSMEAIQSQTGT